MTKPISYADSGVDIDAATRATDRIKELARTTFNQRTLSEIGSFGGMFDGAFPNMSQPVLVASADGVGTKLKIAFVSGVHNTVGRDLVNHCVNDILVQGARPLFFLDYIATGKLSPDVVASIVEGVTIGCRENGCVLSGGETAEMPGFYQEGEYDIAGFIVGIVEQSRVIDGRTIVPDDVLIALPSAGLHTNGYSLARRVFFETAGMKANTRVPELGMTIGDALLAPHRSYLPFVRPLLERGLVKGLAHITGGGITENLPRVLPDGCAAAIDLQSWTVPPIFQLLQERGGIARDEMLRAFNMGVGLVIVCSFVDAQRVIDVVGGHGERGAFRLGSVITGARSVRYV